MDYNIDLRWLSETKRPASMSRDPRGDRGGLKDKQNVMILLDSLYPPNKAPDSLVASGALLCIKQ